MCVHAYPNNSAMWYLIHMPIENDIMHPSPHDVFTIQYTPSTHCLLLPLPARRDITFHNAFDTRDHIEIVVVLQMYNNLLYYVLARTRAISVSTYMLYILLMNLYQ